MIRNIYIGGHDRGGTTLLASFIAGIKNTKIIYETPFKFFYLNNFKKLNFFCPEYKDSKYYKSFGFNDFPSHNQVNSLFNSKRIIVDHTPKNLFFKSELNNKNSLFIFIKRDLVPLYFAHQRVSWGIKSPFKFCVWYFTVYSLINKYNKDKNVITISFEDLVTSKKDLLNKLLIKYNFVTKGKTKINLPKYTLSQHSKVNSKIDLTNLKPDSKKLSIIQKILLKEWYIYKIISKIILRYYVF